MMAAPVGDDVYGDDPTVMLCRTTPQSFPVKKPPFFCHRHSGQPGRSAQSLRTWRRVIVGQAAHNYLFEAGGAAVLGVFSRNPSTRLPTARYRWIKCDENQTRRYPFRPHQITQSGNTHNGKVLPREYLKEAWEFTASAIWRCMLTVRASLMPWWLRLRTERDHAIL